MSTLETINLCKRFRDFSIGPIDLVLEPGSVHGLIGANGAGKTTFFRCLMGTVRRDQGIIKLNGETISDSSAKWKEAIGYVGDYFPLFENWSGARNLHTFSQFYSHYDHELVQRLASRFDVNLDQRARNYSTGQRTKLALIHALAHGANFLLLDEPTSGLDPIARDTLMEILYEQLRRDDMTILYATHYVAEIEQVADQLIIIHNGKILDKKVKEDLAQHWRKITFRFDQELGELPNQVSIKVYGDAPYGEVALSDGRPNLVKEYEVISSNHQSTVMFLENVGAQSIQSNRLSMEQICVQLLKSQLGR